MTKRPRRHPRLRVLVLNTHSGWSIRNGTLAELMEETRPHVLLLQEITPGGKRALRALLGDGWLIRGRRDSIVCVRRNARFGLIHAWSPDNSFGERHERHATGVEVLDRRSNRVLQLQSVHVQPLGKGLAAAALGAVRRQTKQLLTYVRQSAAAPDAWVVLDAGDVNQRVDLTELERVGRREGRLRRTVEALWARAGMVRADDETANLHGPEARLDVAMIRPDDHVRVIRHEVIETTRALDDHPALFLVLGIDPLPRSCTKG